LVTRIQPASSLAFASKSLAGHLLKKLLVGFKHLVVSTLEVSTLGLIPQRLVANPAEDKALCLIHHPEFDTTPSRDPMVPL
jgi:hypothetical protein